MLRWILIVSSLGLTSCTACNDGSNKAASSSALPAPVNPRLEPIPTEEDFEAEAIREITPDALDSELDRLAKEIEP